MRLAAAVEIARADPPRLIAGGLLERTEAEVEGAARSGRVVVLHSAVAVSLTAEDRLRFDAMMRRLVAADACDWISNEGEPVLPSVSATAHARGSPEERFVVGLNGDAVAWAHGHGASMTWVGPSDRRAPAAATLHAEEGGFG